MEPEQPPLAIFPSEGSRGIASGPQQARGALRPEDCLATFKTERTDTPAKRTGTSANGGGRTPRSDSLTRFRMAVSGFQAEMNELFQGEMNKLKSQHAKAKSQRAMANSQRAKAPKVRAVPRDTRELWRRARHLGLFAACMVPMVAVVQLTPLVISGLDAARTLTLSNVDNVEAATIGAPSATVASRALKPLRPAAAPVLLPRTVAPMTARRASSPPVRQRVATNGGSQPRAQGKFKGSLVIDSVPQGATVLINQSRVGVTPMRLDDYPAGSYALWVQRDGYERWTTAVLVPADRVTQVTSKLRRVE